MDAVGVLVLAGIAVGAVLGLVSHNPKLVLDEGSVVTAVWGIAYLAEAGARIVIVANTSTGTAFAVSKVMPYVVTAALVVWNVGYGRLQKRRGEAPAAAADARAGAELRAVALGGRATGRYPHWILNWVYAVVKW